MTMDDDGGAPMSCPTRRARGFGLLTVLALTLISGGALAAGVSASGGCGAEDSRLLWRSGQHNAWFKYHVPLQLDFQIKANEAGSSLTGGLGYHWANRCLRSSQGPDGVAPPRELLWLMPGVIWIGNEPFFLMNLLVVPTVALWKDRLRFGYTGQVATLPSTRINSWLYSSHGLHASIGASAGRKIFSFRAGTLLQGGFSHPTYDDIYATWLSGLQMVFADRVQAYVIVTADFAASSTGLSSWYLDYRPRYQGAEVGLGVKLETAGDRWTLAGFADFDHIQPAAGVRVARRHAGLRVFVSAGASSWNSEFFESDADFFVFAGIRHEFDDRSSDASPFIQTRVTADYGNMNLGSSPEFTVLGRDDLALIEAGAQREAAVALLGSGSFEELSARYVEKDAASALAAASYFGRVLADVGYAYDVVDKMFGLGFYDPAVEDMASRDYEDIFSYLQRYVQHHEAHGSFADLPADLEDGVAICAGIHEFVAEFLRRQGMRAYAVSVNTKKTGHVVTLAFHEGEAVILDYGARLTARSGSLDEALRLYSRHEGSPIFQSQIFGPEGRYLGTYTTAEGRLLHKTFRVDPATTMKRRVLDIW
jgi:hypothetical protein